MSKSIQMKTQVGEWALLFKTAFAEWLKKDPFRESAAIAYYAIFSLPGLLLLVILFAGYFFGRDAVSGQLHDRISAALGGATADEVREIMNKAAVGAGSARAAVVGIVTTLLGATGVFVQLQQSLNSIWPPKPRPDQSGVRTFLRARLFSFGLVLSIAFLLLVSLVAASLLAAVGRWMKSGGLMLLYQSANSLISLSLVSVLFAIMLKILPEAKIKWAPVWAGALLAGILFEGGRFGLAVYFSQANPASSYGAAGSLVLLLLWVFYSSMIFLYGAEFTKACADRYHGYAPPPG